MKLKDKINEELEKQNYRIIKIGASSGYFYCYYLNELTLDRVRKESEKRKKFYQRKIITISNWLNKYEKKLDNAIKKVMSTDKKKRSIKKRNKMVEKTKELYAKRKERYENLLRNYQSLNQNFVPFLERNVERVVESDTDYEPDTLIIIISGNEKGDYGLIDDYAYSNNLDIKEKDQHYTYERYVDSKRRKKDE